jgi:Tfp pilus assembly protein PilF
MAYETKVILTLLAQQVGRAKSLKEAYMIIVKAANVEGVILPNYEQFLQEIDEMQE